MQLEHQEHTLTHLPHVRYVFRRSSLVSEHDLRDQRTGQDHTTRCSHAVVEMVLGEFRHVVCGSCSGGDGWGWPAVSRLFSEFRVYSESGAKEAQTRSLSQLRVWCNREERVWVQIQREGHEKEPWYPYRIRHAIAVRGAIKEHYRGSTFWVVNPKKYSAVHSVVGGLPFAPRVLPLFRNNSFLAPGVLALLFGEHARELPLRWWWISHRSRRAWRCVECGGTTRDQPHHLRTTARRGMTLLGICMHVRRTIFRTLPL